MSESFKQLFLTNTPMLDVRAPVEFRKGSFPSATNIPVLNDDERHDVGVCYKLEGPAAATELGHRLVTGANRQAKLDSWTQFVRANADTHLFCFRGGQRSRIACQWLAEAGIDVPRIEGGYKAMRAYLLAQFDSLPPILIVSGYTGVGKTDLIEHLASSIDLEGLANHRGSAFGQRVAGQPSQIDFENALAIELLKRQQPGAHGIVLEDEGRLIGRIQIPVPVKRAMDNAPVVVLQEQTGDRVARIHRDYILGQFAELQQHDPVSALDLLAAQLLTATDGIRKRLGGTRHTAVRAAVEDALAHHRCGDLDQHRIWIEMLLRDYYDPMYAYQLAGKKDRIVFQGDRRSVLEFVESGDWKINAAD